MRLTKSKRQALEAALCLDQVLYRRFFHLTEELARRERALAKRPLVIGVYRKRGTGNTVRFEPLHILEVDMTPQGTRVVVQ